MELKMQFCLLAPQGPSTYKVSKKFIFWPWASMSIYLNWLLIIKTNEYQYLRPVASQLTVHNSLASSSSWANGDGSYSAQLSKYFPESLATDSSRAQWSVVCAPAVSSMSRALWEKLFKLFKSYQYGFSITINAPLWFVRSSLIKQWLKT